jgi:hypothetical protein
VIAKRGKRAELHHWLSLRAGAHEDTQPPAIGETDFAQLMAALAPISENYLKKLLRDSGAPLAPLVAGVRQSTLDELEASLLALLGEYERADPPRRAAVRRLVITAKDHARWASRRAQRASARSGSSKSEMILWMVTWLENPPVFREWIKLRRSALRMIHPHP